MSSQKRAHEGDDRTTDEGPGPAKQVKVEQDDEVKPAIVSSTAEADKAAEAAAAIAARLAQQYGKPAAPPSQHKDKPDSSRDFEFVKDIEINDLRNRYLLTKGPTQQQILQDTGAAVLTKGVWYPDKSMATDKDPALYLHITAESQEKLDAGIKAVEELIAKDLEPLVYDRSRRDRFEGGERDNGYGGRRKWDEEKLYLEFEPLRNFNIRAKTVGPGGMFVKWIQQETQTRVQIKGMGSGYIETDTGREAEDPIHINITGPDRAMIDKALEYAKDLYEMIKEKHAEAKAMFEEQMRSGGGGPHGYGQQQQGYGPPGGQQQMYGQPIHYQGAGQAAQSPYNYQAGQYAQPGLTAPLPPGEAPPPPPPSSAPGTTPTPGATSQQDAATAAAGAAQSGMTPEQWSAYWNSLDAASQAYYTQYYAAYAAYGQQPQQLQQAAQTPAPPSSAPPPPPPSSAPPPPPPPPADQGPKGGQGQYGAVPPPPGL